MHMQHPSSAGTDYVALSDEKRQRESFKTTKSQRIGSSSREGIRLTALQSQYVKSFSGSPSEFS